MSDAERVYTLTKEQFETLLAYFERATTAVSNEEVAELLRMDTPLRDMLRAMR